MAEGLIVRRAQRQFPFAVGGTETVIEQNGKFYRVHTYTDVGTDDFEVLRGGDVEYLVVAGGGGARAGGGGGGGVVVGGMSVAANSFPIVVGAGGQGAGDPPDNGENSTALGIVAIGGGGSGGAGEDGQDGGSGGGGARSRPRVQVGGSALQPTSPSGGLGHDGGNSVVDNGNSGGGGGAGGPGQDGQDGSLGGIGFETDISGTSAYYAGGGVGTLADRSEISTNQPGGGGASEEDGVPNTGGGGGGEAGGSGGSGGSGIAIIRYRITQAEYEAA